MEKNKIIVTVKIPSKKIEEDISVPLFITANDLFIALNTAYSLGMDVNDISKCYLKAENPIALLKGNRTLEEFGIHDASIIIINNQKV